MKAYILMGSQPLEIANALRVEPSIAGTPFEADLSPDLERSLLAMRIIILAPEGTEKKGRK